MKYAIDGSKMTTRAAAHGEIARALELPDYYGGNLDALWDVVSTMDAELVLINPAPMLNSLGRYGCKLLSTLYEAAENGGVRFRVE